MRSRHRILYFLIGSLLITFGCARRFPISYDEIKPNARVKIQTFSGQTCDGVIQEKKIDHLLLKVNRYDNILTTIKREEIARITGREFVYDGIGEIVSEWEIKDNQKNKNFLLYTIGGAGLSFGASFFIGSLIHRNLDDAENGSKVLWGTTAMGTAAGTYLFARTGKKRDRYLAIEQIREQRFEAARNQVENQKQKRDSIQQQLEKEKAKREKQQQELRLLQEKVKNKKKK
jgi:hypothetical protein